MRNRSLRVAAALAGQFIASRFPGSPLATVVWYAALGYITLDMMLTARGGYLRRLPHWTAESWRQYRRACAIPGVAMVVFWVMELTVDFGVVPPIGAPASTLRGVWAVGMVVLLLVSAWGVANAVNWLADGDPSRQFTRRRQSGATLRTAN